MTCLVSEASLAAPGLPQAQSGVLDLGSAPIAQDRAVIVQTPTHPSRKPGDLLQVRFTPIPSGRAAASLLHRLRYLQNPETDPPDTQYEVWISPLSALAQADYEVSYMVTSRTGNTSLSHATRVRVRNPPHPASAYSVGSTSLSGTYLAGVLQSWIVPRPCALDPATILARALGASTPGARLSLRYVAPDASSPGLSFASVTCADDGTTWATQAQAGPGAISLVRGTLVHLYLDGAPPAQLRLALCL